MPAISRIIDANANRAREALRVMEDAARFVVSNVQLTSDLKQLRHDLSRTLSSLEGLSLSRNVESDVGTDISTSAEMSRTSVADVAIAAGKRLTEALRSIEEFAKLLPACDGESSIAAIIERRRYSAYEIEQRLNAALMRCAPRQWPICVLVTESLCMHHHWLDVCRQAVEAGAPCIQIREKEIDAGELIERIGALRESAPNVTIIVNDQPDIAMASDADGVHLGQTDMKCKDVRTMFGQQLIIGVSTSRLEEAEQALADGADYCGVGPMFPTQTKGKDHIVGPDYMRAYLEWDRLPHLAIGGVCEANVDQLAGAGCSGIAVSSAVCGAADPGPVVKALLGALTPHEPAIAASVR